MVCPGSRARLVRRARIQLVLAVVCGLLTILAAVTPMWIEEFTSLTVAQVVVEADDVVPPAREHADRVRGGIRLVVQEVRLDPAVPPGVVVEDEDALHPRPPGPGHAAGDDSSSSITA